VTSSYEARARGVGKMMSLVEAKRRCPELLIVNGEVMCGVRKAREVM
jgi:nucleotidyltransferase/DNA polymerase involved in DNA repair